MNMRFLVLSLVCLAVSFEGLLANEFQLDHDFHRSLAPGFSHMTKVNKRMKRQTNDFCATMCSIELDTNLKTFMPEEYNNLLESESQDPFTGPTFTTDQFTTFCNDIYKPFIECIDKCESSAELDEVQRSLKPVDFICVDRFDDYIRNLPCFASYRNATLEKCLYGICADKKDAPKKLKEATAMLQYTRDFSNIKKLMADNCELVECLWPCEKHIIKHGCGKDAARLMRDDLEVIQDTTKQTFVNYNLMMLWPHECDLTFLQHKN